MNTLLDMPIICGFGMLLLLLYLHTVKHINTRYSRISTPAVNALLHVY